MILSKVVIKNGFVDGKKIIKAWESITGWKWLAIKESYKQNSLIKGKEHKNDKIYYGFVIGTDPEWGYFSQAELESNKPIISKINEKDIPFIDRECH